MSRGTKKILKGVDGSSIETVSHTGFQNETSKCLHSQEEQTYNISYLKVNKKEALSA